MSATPPEEVTMTLRRAMEEELIETLKHSIAYLHRQLAALEQMRQRDLDLAEKHMNEKHALQRQLEELKGKVMARSSAEEIIQIIINETRMMKDAEARKFLEEIQNQVEFRLENWEDEDEEDEEVEQK